MLGGMLLMGAVEEQSVPFWELLLEMNSFDCKVNEMNQGAMTLVLIWLKPFEWLGRRHSFSPGKILRVLCGSFEHHSREQLEGCVVEPLQTMTATPGRSGPACSVAL